MTSKPLPKRPANCFPSNSLKTACGQGLSPPLSKRTKPQARNRHPWLECLLLFSPASWVAAAHPFNSLADRRVVDCELRCSCIEALDDARFSWNAWRVSSVLILSASREAGVGAGKDILKLFR